jgi:hypothetical protein
MKETKDLVREISKIADAVECLAYADIEDLTFVRIATSLERIADALEVRNKCEY